jgi:hypothetical protein
MAKKKSLELLEPILIETFGLEKGGTSNDFLNEFLLDLNP